MQSKPTQAHGPYIVATKRPDHDCLMCGGCGERQSDGGVCENGMAVSRRAVATPEEARTAVADICVERGQPEPITAPIPESGGTVGPLPDGTVIEVEPATWREIAPWKDSFTTEEQMLVAYNVRAEGLMS